jgi:hypothetical protein
MYSDSSGEFIVAMMIGAFVNMAIHVISGNYNGNVGSLLLAGAIGALTGLAGAGLGNLAHGVGFFSTAAVNAVGFGAGALVGAATGLGAGFVGGVGNSLLSGASMGDALLTGFKAGVSGMLIGAAVGGVMGGIRARKMDLGFWSGEKIPEPMLSKFIARKYSSDGLGRISNLTDSAGGESYFDGINELDAIWGADQSMSAWDLDGNTIMSLNEANNWYRIGNGMTVNVNAASVDLHFINPDDWEIGDVRSVQTLLKSGSGRVFGSLTLQYKGNDQFRILTDNYGFEMHQKRILRNLATKLGKSYAGFGRSFDIQFIGYKTVIYVTPPSIHQSPKF